MSIRLFLIKLLKKTNLARPVKRLIVSTKKQTSLEDGTVPLPTNIIFEPTTKCNLNCQMCYQREERKMGKQDLSFEEIQKIISNLGNVKRVSLIGAEIFTRGDIFQIIEEFLKRGIGVFLTTNGTLINENNISELMRLKKGIRGIGFSLDGPKKLHNKIRGRDWAFDRTIKAINLTKKDFNVSINTVIMDENLEQLPNLARFLKDLGIINFGVTLEMFTIQEDINSSKKILNQDELPLAIEIKSRDKYQFPLSKLQRKIEQMKEIGSVNLTVDPEVFNKFPEEFYNGEARKKNNLVCKNMSLGRIDSQGNVIFCPFIKRSFGNLLEEPMEKIWDNEEFKSFRRNLLKNNLLPICKRCCRLGVR